ncbi:MAG: (Fe-S)-binding protein [Chloroflexota bacterium]
MSIEEALDQQDRGEALARVKTREALQTLVRGIGAWVAAQLEACTRCGMCADACPFYQATGNPECAPIWKLDLLRRAYEQRYTLGGRAKLAIGLDKPITEEELWRWSKMAYHSCTVCHKCSQACPMGIQLGQLIQHVRSALSAGGMVPADLMAVVNKQTRVGSPLGVGPEAFKQRLDWVRDEWDVEVPLDVIGADTLVVFTSIELMKFPENVAAVAKILNRAGERWTISSKGRELVNFGYFEGNPDRTALFINRVMSGARELGVKRIVTGECGHGYDVLRWVAPNVVDVPAGLQVLQITSLLSEYIRADRIRLKPGAFDGPTVTFHDACKVQRRGGLIEEPREILRILAASSFKEMSPNREQAICCGGGGGVFSIKAADSHRYAVFRLKMAQLAQVDAKVLVTTCANCRLHLTDSVQHFNLDVRVRGLSEMVAEAMV